MHQPTAIILIPLMLSACSMSTNQANETSLQVLNSQPVKTESYVEMLKLASGYSLVVSEGALEPRSIGSVTVKLYRDLVVGDFVSGLSFNRDGTVLKSVLIENDSDKQKLSITTVTAGSGNYQERQLICISGVEMSLC